MPDLAGFRTAAANFRQATYWKSPSKIAKGYAAAYPSESAAVSAYLDAIAAGQQPTPPVCQTEHGKGIVGMVGALLAGAGPSGPTGSTGPTGTTGPTPPPPDPPDGTSFIDDLGMSFYGAAATQSNLDKYGTIDFGTDIAAFASKAGRGLLYTTGNQGYDGGPVGVTNAQATSLGCRLKNSSGQLLFWGSPGSNWLLNPAHLGLRNQWKASVDAFFAANPSVDGLWIDNFVMDFRNFPASYPVYDENMKLLWSTPADFQAAQMVFSNDCHSYVKNVKNKMVVVNAGGAIQGDNGNNDGSNSKLWMNSYRSNVSGMTQEYWQQFDDGDGQHFSKQLWPLTITDIHHYWDKWQTVMTYANGLGLGFYPVCNTDYVTPDYSMIRYMRASFLMEWQGATYGDSILLGDGGHAVDIWHAPETAYDPGQPLGSKVPIGTHAYKREFERYWVYINPYTSDQTLDGHLIPSGDALFVPK